MITTEAENRRLVEKMLGWKCEDYTNEYGREKVEIETDGGRYVGVLSNYTFLTGDQMLLLLEAMAKRGIHPRVQCADAYGDVWEASFTTKDAVWLASLRNTAPAAVRAAALAVIGAT